MLLGATIAAQLSTLPFKAKPFKKELLSPELSEALATKHAISVRVLSVGILHGAAADLTRDDVLVGPTKPTNPVEIAFLVRALVSLHWIACLWASIAALEGSCRRLSCPAPFCSALYAVMAEIEQEDELLAQALVRVRRGASDGTAGLRRRSQRWLDTGQ